MTTDAKTLAERDQVIELLCRYGQFGSTLTANYENASKCADALLVAIQSLRASGTGEGGLNADQMHELNTIAHNLEALSRVGFGHDINNVERHTLRKAAIIVRASGERGSSSSGLSGNTGINVPLEPTSKMITAGRREMPVEFKYWQEGGMLHAKMTPIHECVNPANVYKAMIAAATDAPTPESSRDHEPQKQGERG